VLEYSEKGIIVPTFKNYRILSYTIFFTMSADFKRKHSFSVYILFKYTVLELLRDSLLL